MILDDIEIYVKVIEQNSFSVASHLLRIPKSTVSRRIAMLEERLKVKLINRTTRQLSPTTIGQAYYEKCMAILSQVEEAEKFIKGLQTAPKGLLRISVPVELGQLILRQPISEFLKTYTDISLELDLTNRMVDLVEEGIDLALRIGPMTDSSLMAVKMGNMQGGIYVRPDYFQGRKIPQHPSELPLEECIKFHAVALKKWKFKGPNNKMIEVKPQGRLQVNSMSYMCESTVDGLGIGALNNLTAIPFVKQGKLIEILKDYKLSFADVSLVYPSRKYLSTNVRTFINFIKPRLGSILSQNIS